jgi:phospholipid/cholesterol/gamma-HCH transport system substrate-binding protein
MPRPTSWRALLPGLGVFVAVVMLALAILVYARPGALHGDTYRLYVATEAARGVMTGTDVRVAGRTAGKIRKIEFRPPTVDSTRRLLLELELLDEARRQVRENSVAQIRTGGSLIGAPVLFITAGTTDAAVLEDGDTLRSLPQGDTEDVASRMGQASRAFPAIIADVKVLAAQLRSAQSSIGAAQIEGGAQLGTLADRASQLQGMTFSSDGSIGRALDPRSELRRRAASAMASADSLRTLLGSNRSALGRFRRDSTLAKSIADVRNEVAVVRARLDRAEGTAGRIASDDIVSRRLADVQQSLSRLLDDVRHNPMRYLVF